MPRRTLLLIARFAAVYASLAWLAAVLPVYAQMERPFVWLANECLRERPLESRSLSLERAADGVSRYVYDLRIGPQAHRIERPLHAHGFVALLFAALVLATPWLGARRLAFAAGGGAALVLAICVLMLMSDVALWEEETRAALHLPPGAGPYLIPLGFVAGLHQTAAAGILPIAYWALVATRPSAPRA
ncbi:MAG: hypothetical protein ACHQ6T_11265 [Myxococcota bacterium]